MKAIFKTENYYDPRKIYDKEQQKLINTIENKTESQNLVFQVRRFFL